MRNAVDAAERIAELARDMEHSSDLGHSLVDSLCMAYAEVAQIGKVVRKFDIDLVIDVGAHSGQFSCSLIGYNNFGGQIVAFEPVKPFFDQLHSNLDYWKDRGNFRAVNAAVGETAGKSKINLGAGHGGTSSLLAQTELLGKLASGSALSGQTQEVDVVRIDEFFADEDFDKRRAFLKMDVQGYEMSVLRSCGDMIRKFRLVQSELAGVLMYQEQTRPSELFAFMADNGFEPVCMFNNFGTADKGVYFDFDVMFAQRSEIANLR